LVEGLKIVLLKLFWIILDYFGIEIIK